MWNGTMFVDLDGPLNASSLLSASAELLVFFITGCAVAQHCYNGAETSVSYGKKGNFDPL